MYSEYLSIKNVQKKNDIFIVKMLFLNVPQ